MRIASLQKSYGALEAIREVSFAVGEGEFVSVLGPSGCGKSTLLMMIAGVIAPTAGEIRVKDAKVTGPRRDVGVVFQSPVLLPWRTVLQNVLFPVELMRLPRAQYTGRAMELLRMAKIDEFAAALPRQLSGGMRQRVAICRALVHNPDILLMDEPFSALDAITRDEMGVELLRIWQANRKTVIFVTHSIREAAFLSDRVLVMARRPGTIIDDVAIDLPRPRQIAMTGVPPRRLAVSSAGRRRRVVRRALRVPRAGHPSPRRSPLWRDPSGGHRCASMGVSCCDSLLHCHPGATPCRPGTYASRLGESRLPAVRKVAPVIDRDVDVVLFGRCLDPLPRLVPFGVTDPCDLIEPGDRVADMRRVGEGLLAFVRERERGVTKSILRRGAQARCA